jgi:kynurenine formamidase
VTVLDDARAIAADVTNWGRWGPDDERGTLNLIDAAAVQRGVAAVVSGASISLAVPLHLDMPRLMGQANRLPPLRTSTQVNFAWTGDPATGQFNDDSVVMGLQIGTHWDALSHVAYDDQLYNGFPTSTVTAEAGATRCGIDKVGAVVSRAVLCDLPRQRGVDVVEHGDVITPDDLDPLDTSPGDIVLVRTGAMGRLLAGDRKFYERGSCGFHPDCARWFRARDIAAYAVDTQNPDPFPPRDDSVFVPFHLLALRDLGLLQGQNWNLEALAAAVAADGRPHVLLHATPEPFVGASGAPVAPVATR